MTLTISDALPSAVADLRDRVDGEVRFDAGTRAAYSTDASNFRQVPIGVVVPRTIDAAVEAVAVCREHGLPVAVPRRRHQPGRAVHQRGGRDRLRQVLPPRSCRVDAESRRPASSSPASSSTSSTGSWRRHGLRFGPEPATHHELHARRDDRQQLLRRHRAAHRQGRRQHRLASTCCSTTAPGSPRGEPDDEEYAAHRRGAGTGRRADLPARCAGCATSTPT